MKKVVNAALLSRVNAIVSRHEAKAKVARPNAEKRSWYNFVAKEDEADLYIYDEISSWWGVSANDFVQDLNEINAKTINLYINSPGGSVFEGYAIYSALVRYADKNKATINVIVDGWAASIASVIAMAGDHIKIGAHASFMVHEPWSFAIGTADDMRNEADVLDELESSIIDIYEARTGSDRAELEKWVEAETWFKGQAAVDAGFADEVIPLKTKKEDDEEDKAMARPAASNDADYFAAIFPNIPDDVREALTTQPAASEEKKLPKTIREFKNLLREIGFSNKQADSIAGHGFKDKTEVRDEPAVIEEPTTTDRRDDAEKRDVAAAAIRAAAAAMAIQAAAFNIVHS